MKYTAEEVRAVAKRLHDDITVADGDALMASDMLTDYAERIAAAQVDPVAKPHTLSDFVHAHDAERGQIGKQVAARVDEMMAEPAAQGEVCKICGKDTPHHHLRGTAPTPAQPAERAIGELLAVIHGDGGHYLARHGVEKAATDALSKVYALMQQAAEQPAERVVEGWKLGMAVLQSDLYRELSEEDRAICDALVASNPHITAAQQADR